MPSIHDNLTLGRKALDRGDYAEALQHADAALTRESSSLDALELRSRALYLLGRDAEAMQTLRDVHARLHELALQLDESSLLVEDEEEFADDFFPEFSEAGSDALETLLALRERHALDDELLALLAELAEDAERYDIAREAFEALTAAHPNDREAWEGLVHVLCHEDIDAALPVVQSAITRFPGEAIFHEFLGYLHYTRRQFHAAIIAYGRAIDLGDAHPEKYESLALSYLAIESFDSALDVVQALVGLDPNDADARHIAIEIALDCKRPEEAMPHAHQLLRLEPSHADTYRAKAWVEIVQGEWETAERTLRLGFHKAMEGEFALFELIDDLLNADEPDAAMRVAVLACELAPEHPEALAARGKVLRAMGRFTDALADFQAASALAPQDDAYQTWVGVALDNLGEYPQALRQFARVLSRNPADAWTLTNRALTLIAMESFEAAQADLVRALEIDPHDGVLYFWRACIAAQRDERADAFRDLRRALDLNEEIYPWLADEPLLTPLRRDPRFLALLDDTLGGVG